MKIVKRLENNIAELEKTFDGCGDIVARKMPVGERYSTYVTYIDGLVDRSYIEDQLILNLIVRLRTDPQVNTPNFGHFGEVIDAIRDFGISSADITEITDIESAAEAMMSGDCVLLVDSSEKGIVLSSKGWPNRGITEADNEKALQGSKEAFTETMRMNTALIRRRIRDARLKITQLKAGRRSKTDIAVVYMDDVVRKEILTEALERINKIDIDAVLDSGYIEQLIEETKTPFPLTQITERPDKAASAVLEGRIAIIVDNSPYTILIPATFNTFFQASEDYYQRYQIMSITRVLRYIAAFMAVSLPGIYIALTVYNPAMIPSPLALKMAAARQGIPFPAVVEILLMELAFELLREAGIRLPGTIGGTLGIVGGLIMGQAAVEAGIVSPIVVIVVALSGIASFAIPQPSLVTGLRITKFMVIAMSALLGLFGFVIAVLTVLTHLVTLKSFGIPYMFPLGCSDIKNNDMKDTLIRVPLKKMTDRPVFANPRQKKRMTGQEDKKV